MTGRIAIDDTAPSVPGGFPAKAVVGEVFPVRAVVWREG
ncbi:maltotransferase domain-containing protein, partial [Nocardia gipuzkoensis]